MQRFRAFTSAGWDDDIGRMEQAINDWLDSDHPHVHMMAQASLGEHLVVSFVYADSYEAAAAEEAETVAEVFERNLENSTVHEDVDLSVTLPVMELPY